MDADNEQPVKVKVKEKIECGKEYVTKQGSCGHIGVRYLREMSKSLLESTSSSFFLPTPNKLMSSSSFTIHPLPHNWREGGKLKNE